MADLTPELLAYLAANEEELAQFLNLTGTQPDQLRAMVQSPDFARALLDYYLSNEPLTLAFCAHEGVKPGDLVRAFQNLGGVMPQ